MAWIEKKGGSWRVGWREAGGRQGKRRYAKAPSRKVACELKSVVERDIALHGRVTCFDPAPVVPALGEGLEKWIAAQQLAVSPRTVTSYSDALVLFLRYLCEATRIEAAALSVDLLTREHLTGFQAWLLAGGRTLSTAAKRAQAVRLAWEWLYEGDLREWIDAPPRKIQTRKRAPPKPISPTWEECDACIAACWQHDPRAKWLYPFAVAARFTGLRRSEIMLLRWEHIEGGILTVPGDLTKGECSGRRVPLSAYLLEELIACREGPFLIPAPEGERVAAEGDGRGHVDRNMRRAWIRAGVRPEAWKGQPCHAFRKALQTELERVGVRREVTEYLVGHQPTGTGARHYIDAERALWPDLVKAVALIPPVSRPVAMREAS